MNLTPNQQKQLQALRYAGALTLATAVGPFDGCSYFSNNVLARLVGLGLTRAHVVRPGQPLTGGRTSGGQQTVYWLTEAGLELTV